ncbi:MAG: ATP-binding cassette domain-containing protein, partial [Lachnospiraceae bacterium]|nr:ATP-binding cassette domain-containing protein [Lachnospiraceae bacterium]
KNVEFAYNPDNPLIENLNLEVMPGQNVAIVGPTGCGKTTLINLLMRFYDTVDGQIIIDGKAIKDMRRHELRHKFGMVLQDTWIKEASVLDNILLGKKDATKEEAIEAAKAVHAHSFIKRLPKGYDTVLDEDGNGLSAGQKQLLCIARVMLMQPPMLILDEATSNIDTRTELIISRAFNKLMENRTSFVVAHRLSTIKNADIILVMKDGHIIEQGNHDSLIKQGGFYKKLYMSQYQQA